MKVITIGAQFQPQPIIVPATYLEHVEPYYFYITSEIICSHQSMCGHFSENHIEYRVSGRGDYTMNRYIRIDCFGELEQKICDLYYII